MGEAHDAVADVDDLGALGLRQRIVAGHRVHDRQRRLAHRGGHREGAARGRRQAVQPGADERVERHRQPLAGLAGAAIPACTARPSSSAKNGFPPDSSCT